MSHVNRRRPRGVSMLGRSTGGAKVMIAMLVVIAAGQCSAKPPRVPSSEPTKLQYAQNEDHHAVWRMEATSVVAAVAVKDLFCKLEPERMCDTPQHVALQSLQEWASTDPAWHRRLLSLSNYELGRWFWQQEDYQRSLEASEWSIAYKLFPYQDPKLQSQWQQTLMGSGRSFKRIKLELADGLVLMASCMHGIGAREGSVEHLYLALEAIHLAGAMMHMSDMSVQEVVGHLELLSTHVAQAAVDALMKIKTAQLVELMEVYGVACDTCVERRDHLEALLVRLSLPIRFSETTRRLVVLQPALVNKAYMQQRNESVQQFAARLMQRLVGMIRIEMLSALQVPCTAWFDEADCASHLRGWLHNTTSSGNSKEQGSHGSSASSTNSSRAQQPHHWMDEPSIPCLPGDTAAVMEGLFSSNMQRDLARLQSMMRLVSGSGYRSGVCGGGGEPPEQGLPLPGKLSGDFIPPFPPPPLPNFGSKGRLLDRLPPLPFKPPKPLPGRLPTMRVCADLLLQLNFLAMQSNAKREELKEEIRDKLQQQQRQQEQQAASPCCDVLTGETSCCTEQQQRQRRQIHGSSSSGSDGSDTWWHGRPVAWAPLGGRPQVLGLPEQQLQRGQLRGAARVLQPPGDDPLVVLLLSGLAATALISYAIIRNQRRVGRIFWCATWMDVRGLYSSRRVPSSSTPGEPVRQLATGSELPLSSQRRLAASALREAMAAGGKAAKLEAVLQRAELLVGIDPSLLQRAEALLEQRRRQERGGQRGLQQQQQQASRRLGSGKQQAAAAAAVPSNASSNSSSAAGCGADGQVASGSWSEPELASSGGSSACSLLTLFLRWPRLVLQRCSYSPEPRTPIVGQGGEAQACVLSTGSEHNHALEAASPPHSSKLPITASHMVHSAAADLSEPCSPHSSTSPFSSTDFGNGADSPRHPIKPSAAPHSSKKCPNGVKPAAVPHLQQGKRGAAWDQLRNQGADEAGWQQPTLRKRTLVTSSTPTATPRHATSASVVLHPSPTSPTEAAVVAVAAEAEAAVSACSPAVADVADVGGSIAAAQSTLPPSMAAGAVTMLSNQSKTGQPKQPQQQKEKHKARQQGEQMQTHASNAPPPPPAAPITPVASAKLNNPSKAVTGTSSSQVPPSAASSTAAAAAAAQSSSKTQKQKQQPPAIAESALLAKAAPIKTKLGGKKAAAAAKPAAALQQRRGASASASPAVHSATSYSPSESSCSPEQPQQKLHRSCRYSPGGQQQPHSSRSMPQDPGLTYFTPPPPPPPPRPKGTASSGTVPPAAMPGPPAGADSAAVAACSLATNKAWATAAQEDAAGPFGSPSAAAFVAATAPDSMQQQASAWGEYGAAVSLHGAAKQLAQAGISPTKHALEGGAAVHFGSFLASEYDGLFGAAAHVKPPGAQQCSGAGEGIVAAAAEVESPLDSLVARSHVQSLPQASSDAERMRAIFGSTATAAAAPAAAPTPLPLLFSANSLWSPTAVGFAGTSNDSWLTHLGTSSGAAGAGQAGVAAAAAGHGWGSGSASGIPLPSLSASSSLHYTTGGGGCWGAPAAALPQADKAQQPLPQLPSENDLLAFGMRHGQSDLSNLPAPLPHFPSEAELLAPDWAHQIMRVVE